MSVCRRCGEEHGYHESCPDGGDWTSDYPYRAGAKDDDTGREAAEAIENSGRAGMLRVRVLQAFIDAPSGLTADEVAALLGEDILSIRPRVTELKKQGKLRDTGHRRPSQNGKSQRVLEYVDPAKTARSSTEF